jgi:hypothetical protein
MDDKGQEAWRPIDEPEPLTRLGDCLHASFAADNHDSLSDDIVRSLLDLSREEKTASMRAKLSSARDR